MPKISLPFGPYHPALGEPEYFQVVVDGENIVAVDFDLGYNYREMEKKVLNFIWDKATHFLGRICGICSSAHTQAFTLAVEKVNGMEVPPRAKWIRTFGAEIERISSHLLWLGLFGEMAGFEPLFYLSWGAREHALNILEKFGGRRVHYAYMAFGGVHQDLKPTPGMEAELRGLKQKYEEIREMVMASDLLADRFRGVGVVTPQQARDYGLVGPTARGSGVNNDIRKDMPYNSYEEHDFTVPIYKGGDSYARAMVRLDEIRESIRILEQIVNGLPKGKLTSVNSFTKSRLGEATQSVEAPRGENFHFVRAGELTPQFLRVRPPTFANLSVIPEMLKGRMVSDVPVVISSIDPCFACTDRVILIDRSDKSIREVQL
ncbi:MAG TPA: NADH dehydrogenase subunit [archaeon]|nr:NADH dehydrogenase subunit [archaeon]